MKYLAITAILCLILAGASFAGNVVMTEVITDGNLTLTMPANFSFVTAFLGGSSIIDKSAFATYVIEDARGSGAGWNLGVQISQFQTGGTPNRTIPTASYYHFLPLVNYIFGQTISGTYGPKSLIDSSEINISGSETKIVTAAANYGMGKYSCQCTHRIYLPAETYAGTYTATLTATLNAVP